MSRVLPILFNTKMVRAILDDRKKATRRLVMPHNRKKAKELGYCQGYGLWIDFSIDNLDGEGHIKDYSISDCWMRTSIYIQKYAQYRPGDILYVRETWNYVYNLDDNDQIVEDTGRYVYYADDPMPFLYWTDPDTGERKDQMPWKPSIHMPKGATRIWLRVTDVRVERLQDMETEDDRNYIAEGAKDKHDFIIIWDSTVKDKEYRWYGNPWVWVIEFERCEKPEEVKDNA